MDKKPTVGTNCTKKHHDLCLGDHDLCQRSRIFLSAKYLYNNLNLFCDFGFCFGSAVNRDPTVKQSMPRAVLKKNSIFTSLPKPE